MFIYGCFPWTSIDHVYIEDSEQDALCENFYLPYYLSHSRIYTSWYKRFPLEEPWEGCVIVLEENGEWSTFHTIDFNLGMSCILIMSVNWISWGISHIRERLHYLSQILPFRSMLDHDKGLVMQKSTIAKVYKHINTIPGHNDDGHVVDWKWKNKFSTRWSRNGPIQHTWIFFLEDMSPKSKVCTLYQRFFVNKK